MAQAPSADRSPPAKAALPAPSRRNRPGNGHGRSSRAAASAMIERAEFWVHRKRTLNAGVMNFSIVDSRDGIGRQIERVAAQVPGGRCSSPARGNRASRESPSRRPDSSSRGRLSRPRPDRPGSGCRDASTSCCAEHRTAGRSRRPAGFPDAPQSRWRTAASRVGCASDPKPSMALASRSVSFIGFSRIIGLCP